MLKYIILLLIATHSFYAADSQSEDNKLIIEIDNLNSSNGFIRIQIFNSNQKNYFPKESSLAFRNLVQKVVKKNIFLR